MQKPRMLDQIALELGDRFAFSSRLARGRRPFQPAHVEPQWARDRAAAIRHIRLEVALDFERKSIAGTATHRIAAIADGLDHIEFDAAEMEIRAVRAGGEPCRFETGGGKLEIMLPRAIAAAT